MPPTLSPTFFGWVPQLLRIPESELLDCVGLDAVMMLRFFTMSMRLFAVCLISGLLIILPVNYLTMGEAIPEPDPGNDDGMEDDPTVPTKTSLLYLFTQFTFTWIFSLQTTYSIWRTYEGYISIRRRYLLKRAKTITNRTVMIVGLPPYLQSDRALATFYESLGVGTVESAHVVRHVSRLKRLLEQRAFALRALELVYTEYYGNPSSRKDFDPDKILQENERLLENLHQENTTVDADGTNRDGPRPNSELTSASYSPKKRPTIRLGFLGLFGKKVDKIDHRREVFATLDKAVQKMRLSRIYTMASIGFVTFEDMHSAQILAQTVNTRETLSCETSLAPEPRDVYWNNLNLPPTELTVRSLIINVNVFLMVFFWAGPVSLFSSFLNLESLEKLIPGISVLADKSPIIKSLIQGFLPTVGVIVFLAVVPLVLVSLCRQQGCRSHSEIARSLYNKYFAFIFVNIVLVFTIVGTWAQAANKVYHNLGELTLILATSLPRVAPFFVNFIILRGIGLFPLQLLQIGDVFNQVFQGVLSRTPRDYAEMRAPPQLPYGVVYANATLVFVIILIYSCIKPLILIFGVIYFAVGYVVFKYQLLYVYFHPNESGGQTWPMVYNRLTVGLFIFQLMMLGLFFLKQSYFFGALLAPLPVATAYFWYWTTKMYKITAKFVPLELLHTACSEDDIVDCPSDCDVVDIPAEESNGADHVVVGMEGETRGATAAKSTSAAPVPSATVTTPSGSRRRVSKSVVDEDDYQQMPDLYTDYHQPPMTLYSGILNSGMRHYSHPAISGPLPTLWLPLKRVETEDDKKKKGKRRVSRRVEDEEALIDGNGRPRRGSGSSSSDEDSTRRHLSLGTDQRLDFDQADNLMGGGQDEDEAGMEGGSSEHRHHHHHHGASGAAVVGGDREREGSVSALSDVTGGPSSPGTPPGEAEVDETRPGSSRRNPAVEGVSDIYYHHPERRLSNAGGTRSAWRAMMPPRLQGSSSRLRGSGSSSRPSPPAGSGSPTGQKRTWKNWLKKGH
ncbi:hypothetical protein BGW38_007635 [Lunasporangiospora selenospora]|uniref:DUF221-domain-containing protein n=1 Tax=Lunasporangiospora selenospora TaxID=979761 RepID=A0A9P6FY96_9FUNG|nr:hypothetical protein BGW38_007635 [Lunasporangiospora selenospora]